MNKKKHILMKIAIITYILASVTCTIGSLIYVPNNYKYVGLILAPVDIYLVYLFISEKRWFFKSVRYFALFLIATIVASWWIIPGDYYSHLNYIMPLTETLRIISLFALFSYSFTPEFIRIKE